jgi:hypothetical protein
MKIIDFHSSFFILHFSRADFTGLEGGGGSIIGQREALRTPGKEGWR